MKSLEPIFLVDLLPQIDQKLFQILESLSDDDWEKQSLAPKWKIKDIAAHLLDGNLRTLSMLRDSYFGEKPENHQGLISFLNRLNADWVTAFRRISPKVMIELLKISGQEYYDYLKSLDPFDKSPFSVGWAGESESLNWFHIAREYTEKWHHQQQIRFAVNQTEELYSTQFYSPYLNTSMRALPFHYRDFEAQEGELIQFEVIGQGGGSWFLLYSNYVWSLGRNVEAIPGIKVKIPQEIAWRVFTKGIHKQEALEKSEIIGNYALGAHFFDLIAIMA